MHILYDPLSQAGDRALAEARILTLTPRMNGQNTLLFITFERVSPGETAPLTTACHSMVDGLKEPDPGAYEMTPRC